MLTSVLITGDHGSSLIPPLLSAGAQHHQLINFIKRFYKQYDTKEQLYNNVYCDTILELIFVETDKGSSALEPITYYQYEIL